MFIKIPFEAKLLLLACFALFLFGCGSGETTESRSDNVTLNPEEALITEFPIVYITRSEDLAEPNVLDLDAFNPGATLYARVAANTDSPEVNISQQLFGNDVRYDVRDINISYDGTLMVFAARGPFDETIDPESDEEQPSVWNLYEYSFVTGQVSSIMNEEIAALGHDITPHYLADDRIIFSSSRQQRAGEIMLDEGKSKYAYQVEVDDSDPRAGAGFALHIAEFDGNRNLTDIEQVTFNQSHDFDPLLLDNGKIVFSRWDAAGENQEAENEDDPPIMVKDKISFYQMNPDGSELEILFGYRSHDDIVQGQTLQFVNPQLSPNENELIAILRPHDPEGNDEAIVTIDIENFVDVGVPLRDSAASGNGIVDVVRIENTVEEGEAALDGRYSSVTPLFDGTNRSIVSWSFCRLLNENNEVVSCNGITELPEGWSEAPPNYSLWLIDNDNNTQTPLVLGDGNQAPFYDVTIAQPRTAPTSIPDIEPQLASEADVTCEPSFFEQDDGYGIIHIRSVFDRDGEIYAGLVPEGVETIAQLADPSLYSASDRLARFVRFEKPVYRLPSDLKDLSEIDTQFGPFMREILGYAPIQPDSSVKVKVPADVPVMLSLVDSFGQRLEASTQDHWSWIQVRPGEVKECNGCHDRNSTVPHGRRAAGPASLNSGAPSTQGFPNTSNEAYLADISANGDGSITQPCTVNTGETMAEFFVRVDPTRANLSPNMRFDDIWTISDQVDPAPEASFNLSYSTVKTVYEDGVTNGDEREGLLPFNIGDCLNDWESLCRVVINYEDHIQPLWDVTRSIQLDDDSNVFSNCVSCHSTANVDDDGNSIPPAAGLELSGQREDEDDDTVISFDNLFGRANDFARIPDPNGGDREANQLSALDDEGNLVVELQRFGDRFCYDYEGRSITVRITFEQEDVLVPSMVPVLDPDTGEPVLDDDGNPVLTEELDDEGNVVMVPLLDDDGNVVRQDRLDDGGNRIPQDWTIRESDLGYSVDMERAAIDSDNVGLNTNRNEFRKLFQEGFQYTFRQCDTQVTQARDIEFDHAGILSDSELKMIFEWIGIGSAYYNNPFAVPD